MSSLSFRKSTCLFPLVVFTSHNLNFESPFPLFKWNLYFLSLIKTLFKQIHFFLPVCGGKFMGLSTVLIWEEGHR